MQFEISNQKVQIELPSASGIVKFGDFYYAIGDDSPFLFKLDHEFEIIDKYTIHNRAGDMENGRISKRGKPDFEALEMISINEMISFGSGSKIPEREDFIRIIIQDNVKVTTQKLTTFYTALKRLEILQNSELNIEALAYANHVLYLFNRRKNIIFSLNYTDFLNFIDKGADFPEIRYTEFRLPEINGLEAGFSGAAIDERNATILVTSSVENTANAYDDGEILGSFIGRLPIKNLHANAGISWLPINYGKQALKVESITVHKQTSKNSLEIVLTTDNDNGQSLFLKGNLSW